MNRTALALAFVLLSLCGGAFAQGMSDPMRPPAFIENQESTGAAGGPVLQTIVIGPDRRYAIIDGEKVTPGSRFREARVVQIAENQVTLRDAGGDTVLKLYPQVQKLIAQPAQSGREAVQGPRGKQ